MPGQKTVDRYPKDVWNKEDVVKQQQLEAGPLVESSAITEDDDAYYITTVWKTL